MTALPCSRLPCLPALLVVAPLCAALAGCGFPPPLSPADRETLADCRSDADRVYDVRNRAQLSERSSTDTPFSGGSQAASPSDGLADRYAHDEMVDRCVRRGTAEPNATPIK